MILSSSILIGFIRMVLLILFLYYCNNKLVKREGSHTLIQFIVNEWFKYGSLTLIIVFVLIQLNVYSLINFLFVILIFILLDVVGIKYFKNPLKFFKKSSKNRFFEFLKDTENKKSIIERVKLERPKNLKDDRVYVFYCTLILITLAFLGRYYFYTYDTFLLSDLWITDLYKIIQFDNFHWFETTVEVEGELAFANIYSKLVDVSPETGLQTLAIIEYVLLSIIVFWLDSENYRFCCICSYDWFLCLYFSLLFITGRNSLFIAKSSCFISLNPCFTGYDLYFETRCY